MGRLTTAMNCEVQDKVRCAGLDKRGSDLLVGSDRKERVGSKAQCGARTRKAFEVAEIGRECCREDVGLK
jgi:hypothetical protein